MHPVSSDANANGTSTDHAAGSAAHGTELVALLPGGAHVQHAHEQLRDFIQDLARPREAGD